MSYKSDSMLGSWFSHIPNFVPSLWLWIPSIHLILVATTRIRSSSGDIEDVVESDAAGKHPEKSKFENTLQKHSKVFWPGNVYWGKFCVGTLTNLLQGVPRKMKLNKLKSDLCESWAKCIFDPLNTSQQASPPPLSRHRCSPCCSRKLPLRSVVSQHQLRHPQSQWESRISSV